MLFERRRFLQSVMACVRQNNQQPLAKDCSFYRCHFSFFSMHFWRYTTLRCTQIIRFEICFGFSPLSIVGSTSKSVCSNSSNSDVLDVQTLLDRVRAPPLNRVLMTNQRPGTRDRREKHRTAFFFSVVGLQQSFDWNQQTLHSIAFISIDVDVIN